MPRDSTDSSAAIDTTVLPPGDSTGGPVIDTLTHVVRPVPGKSATLGYSYFPEMSRGEIRDVNVYVSVKNPSSRIRDTLQVIVNEQNPSPSSREDTSVIYTINVMVYEALDISLVDPAKDFTITAIHPSDRQVIDTVDGNRWHWTISTTTDKKTARLVLKVIAEKPGGIKDKFEDKTIPINVKISGNIVRTFFNYLTDNPKVSIPILVSLFGFLGWYIKYRLDKKKKT